MLNSFCSGWQSYIANPAKLRMIQNGTYDTFKRILVEKKIPVIIARAGQRFFLDKSVTMDVLYPLTDNSGKTFLPQEVNDSSVATLFSFGSKKFLFMGDASLKEELDLVYSGQDIDVDVLKLSHHGSKNSTARLFLEHTTPSLTFASLGSQNRYGHPHPEVLNRLGNIPFFRTDQQGRILITSDGNTIHIQKEKE